MFIFYILMKTIFLYFLVIFQVFGSDDLTDVQQQQEISRALDERAARPITTDNLDLTFLQSQYPGSKINDYKEDMGQAAKEKLSRVSRKIKKYSLEGDLIPQVVKQVSSDIAVATANILSSIPDECTGIVLYLGRSPSLFQETCAHFSDNAAMRHIQINFSGTPNMVNPRNYELNALRNVVTTERLEHFCRYLELKQLGSLTEKSELYIVDQLGTGASMNAFLQILHHFYIKRKALSSTPRITLLLMNFGDTEEHTQPNMYHFSGQDRQLTFYGSSQRSLSKMKVKAIPLCMPQGISCTLDFLDDEMVQYYLLPGREYPPFCWTESYDAYRDSEPELAPILKAEILKAVGKEWKKVFYDEDQPQQG